MTWVAVVMTPVVVAYQAWSYWIFRKRIGSRHLPKVHAAPAPA
jgi:cytochrome d ubiquinol oxidase subunit II